MHDRPRSGTKPRLDDKQMAQLRQIVVDGPDVEKTGLSAWTLAELCGRGGALQLELDRRVVDAAASYMASEDSSSAYLFSGWAQAALPHKKLPADDAWQVSTAR